MKSKHKYIQPQTMMLGDHAIHMLENLLIKLFIIGYEKKDAFLKKKDDYILLKNIINNEHISLNDFKQSIKITKVAVMNRSNIVGYDAKKALPFLIDLTNQIIKDCFRGRLGPTLF